MEPAAREQGVSACAHHLTASTGTQLRGKCLPHPRPHSPQLRLILSLPTMPPSPLTSQAEVD